MSGLDDRERRFDDELARAARGLVTEELPRGVLDEPVSTSLGLGRAVDGSISGRRPLPGLATAAAAAAVLLLATVVVLAPQLPGGGPGPSATPVPTASPAPSSAPVLRTSAQIGADFEKLGYACRAGGPLESIAPGPSTVVRESVVCTPADTSVFMAAVIVGESAAGEVLEVHVKADFTKGDTPAARAEVASMLAKAAAVAVQAGSGTAVGGWVEASTPAIEPNGGVKAQVEGYALKVGRTSDGGYQLFVTIASST